MQTRADGSPSLFREHTQCSLAGHAVTGRRQLGRWDAEKNKKLLPVAPREGDAWDIDAMACRHYSLIPLSHRHRHALSLAVIVRRRFGKEKGEASCGQKIENAWGVELAGHFQVKEQVLFLEMECYPRKLPPISRVG